MNAEKPTTSLRNCSSCGQRKPLTDFRQLSQARGIIYGNICSSCRQASKGKPTPAHEEDASTSTTELTLGLKEKLQREQDFYDQLEETKEREKKEREEKDKAEVLREENKASIAQKEKLHRNTHLKQSSFLDSNKAISKKIATASTTSTFLRERLLTEEKRVVEQVAAEDKAERELDTTSTQTPMDVGSEKQKYKTALFNTFVKQLSKGSALAKNIENFLKTQQSNEDPRPTTTRKK